MQLPLCRKRGNGAKGRGSSVLCVVAKGDIRYNPGIYF